MEFTTSVERIKKESFQPNWNSLNLIASKERLSEPNGKR